MEFFSSMVCIVHHKEPKCSYSFWKLVLIWYIYGICGAYPLVQQFAKVISNPQVLTDQNINVFPIRTFLHVDKIQNIFAKISTYKCRNTG